MNLISITQFWNLAKNVDRVEIKGADRVKAKEYF